jgi:hypothetical protein
VNLFGAGAFMPLCREAVLGPAFTPGSGARKSFDRSDPPSISPPKAARWRADRRTSPMHRKWPVLKDGPNTASRRRPLKRPQREPTEQPLPKFGVLALAKVMIKAPRWQCRETVALWSAIVPRGYVVSFSLPKTCDQVQSAISFKKLLLRHGRS